MIVKNITLWIKNKTKQQKILNNINNKDMFKHDTKQPKEKYYNLLLQFSIE